MPGERRDSVAPMRCTPATRKLFRPGLLSALLAPFAVACDDAGSSTAPVVGPDADATRPAGEPGADATRPAVEPDAAVPAEKDATAEGDPDADADAGAPGVVGALTAGRYRLDVLAPMGLVLTRDDVPLARVRGLETGHAASAAEAADRTRFFDPANPRVARVEWHALDVAGAPDAAGRIPLTGADGLTATLTATTDAEGRFTFELTPEGSGTETLVQLRLSLDAPAGEAYYGLGELFDTPEHRGRSRPMHIGPTLDSEGLYTEYHVAIPLLLGTGGWGLFVEDRHAGLFDVADTDPERIQVTFEARRLRFHLYGSDTPVDVLQHYVEQTGRPARPAEWAFGGWIWRNENRDQAQVYDDLRALREHDLPMSGMWLDRPWATGINTFVMDPEKFPDPEGLVAAVHAAGLRFAVWASPYLEPATGELWQTAADNGWFVRMPEGWPKPFNEADFVDLTNPAATAFFTDVIRRITDLGAEGFKLDFGEDIQIGAGSTALSFDFHNGETERTMHHGIAPYYHRPFAELTGGDGRNFILSRAGTYGDQTLTTTIWPGDLCNGFEAHLEGRHVGGLPAAIAGGLSLSASGYPFYASDTGGYRHGRAPKDVFLRWTAYAALGSVMQTGGSEHHNPWDFEPYDTGRDDPVESRFDAETLAIYRQFARLYVRLHAYRHPFNEAAHETGHPVTTPLGLAHPELGVHPATQYRLGDALYVAPATDAGGHVAHVLPAGRFFDWFTGETVEGPTVVERDVPFDRISLYVRAGAVIPLLRETVDTLATATDPDVDSYADDPGVLTVRVYPGEGTVRFETLGGTVITVDHDAGQITLEGDHFTGYVFEAHGGEGAGGRLERGPGAQQFDWPPR